MLKHYSFKQKAMMFINLAFYIIFLLMVIYGAFHTNGELLSILFVVVGIIALVFGVLSEYLKLRYNEALWYLNFKLDTAKAKEIYEDMLKKDLFGMYKNDRGLFDVMVAIEEKDGNKALKIIEENDGRSDIIGQIERFAFYEEAKKAYCVIATGEGALYANIMLQKGVVV